MKPIIINIYPRLGNNEVVTIGGEKYRAEFWQGGRRYYEFIFLGDTGKPNFTKTEQEVSNGILEKKIKRH
jgi:hypothetical protein